MPAKKQAAPVPDTVIRHIADELSGNEDVIALILFGSVARGQSRRISDIDLCIVSRPDLPEPEKMELLSYGSRNIDVSLFFDLPLQIRFRVIKEGRTLFCTDPLRLHRIITGTVREYLDFNTFISKYRFRAASLKV